MEIKSRTINGEELSIREAIERGARGLFGDICFWEFLEFEEFLDYRKRLDELKAALNDESKDEKELIRMLTELQLYASHGLSFPYQAYLMGLIDDLHASMYVSGMD